MAPEADPARARAAGRREMRERGLKDGMVLAWFRCECAWGIYCRYKTEIDGNKWFRWLIDIESVLVFKRLEYWDKRDPA